MRWIVKRREGPPGRIYSTSTRIKGQGNETSDVVRPKMRVER